MKALSICLLIIITMFSTLVLGSTVENQSGSQSVTVECHKADFLPDNTSKTSNLANELSYSKADISFAKYCCKTCRKGKACGDTCISKTKACYKPEGCACNG
ncbi:hypothetical protein L2755_03060 [Shewanella abyssi]|uniref:hypothetical protein n=1 Tax=Shewanella abyssi TaxID=311789 RepID=UPI00200F957F|nr:hypothetical protein [Shewanella abyssi]MCL1048616.1 hypothetical protein [Shewanella abyssi]